MEEYPRLCRLPLAAGSKRPLLVRWSTIDPDDDVITTVFAANPHANVGLRLDQFVVIDCDTPAMVQWWFDHGPGTAFTSQGNPEHLSYWYLLDPEDEARPSRRPGIDVKTGPGHQCVVPPSVHPSGAKYRWVAGVPVDEDHLRHMKPIAGTTVSALLDQLAPERGPQGAGEGWDVVMEGEGRDNFLASLGGFLHRWRMSEAAARAVLSTVNQMVCEPAMSPMAIARIARSTSRYNDKTTTYSFEEIN